MFEVKSTDYTVRTFVNASEVYTFDETFNNNFHTFDLICLSNECLRKEINDADGVCELHGGVCLNMANIHENQPQVKWLVDKGSLSDQIDTTRSCDLLI